MATFYVVKFVDIRPTTRPIPPVQWPCWLRSADHWRLEQIKLTVTSLHRLLII